MGTLKCKYLFKMQTAQHTIILETVNVTRCLLIHIINLFFTYVVLHVNVSGSLEVYPIRKIQIFALTTFTCALICCGWLNYMVQSSTSKPAATH